MTSAPRIEFRTIASKLLADFPLSVTFALYLLACGFGQVASVINADHMLSRHFSREEGLSYDLPVVVSSTIRSGAVVFLVVALALIGLAALSSNRAKMSAGLLLGNLILAAATTLLTLGQFIYHLLLKLGDTVNAMVVPMSSYFLSLTVFCALCWAVHRETRSLRRNSTNEALPWLVKVPVATSIGALCVVAWIFFVGEILVRLVSVQNDLESIRIGETKVLTMVELYVGSGAILFYAVGSLLALWTTWHVVRSDVPLLPRFGVGVLVILVIASIALPWANYVVPIHFYEQSARQTWGVFSVFSRINYFLLPLVGLIVLSAEVNSSAQQENSDPLGARLAT